MTDSKETQPSREQIKQALYRVGVVEKLGDIPEIPESLMHTLRDVIDGTCNKESYIRSNIFHAANKVLDGEPLDGELREFIGNALFEIGFGKQDANIAFKLKIGNKPKGQKTQESEIALQVMWKVYNDNMTVMDSCISVGKCIFRSESEVRRIYYKHKKRIVNEIVRDILVKPP